MEYITRAEINALIPPTEVVRALSDAGNNTETVGLFDVLVGLAEDEVNAMVSGAMATPVVPDPSTGLLPPIIKAAARAFLCEALYNRAGISTSNNPWYDRAKVLRERLTNIGQRKEPLMSNVTISGAMPDQDPNLQSMTDQMSTPFNIELQQGI